MESNSLNDVCLYKPVASMEPELQTSGAPAAAVDVHANGFFKLIVCRRKRQQLPVSTGAGTLV